MIIVALLVIGIAACLVTCVLDNNDYDSGSVVLGVASAFLIAGFLICCTVAICVHVSAKGRAAEMQATYESLIYQAEAKMYNNDNELGKKELANQIQEWNEKIAMGKAMQQDFWLGVFYPNIYDQFEPIPLDLLS